MIHVRPAKINEIKEIYGDTITDYANAMIAEDCDKGETVGYSKFEIDDGKFTLFDVVPAEKDIWLCDLITRATMNYAVNRNILICNLAEGSPKHAFKLLRYIENEDIGEINIIHLFTMCKNCEKSD